MQLALADPKSLYCSHPEAVRGFAVVSRGAEETTGLRAVNGRESSEVGPSRRRREEGDRMGRFSGVEASKLAGARNAQGARTEGSVAA